MGLRFDILGDIAVINKPSDDGEVSDAKKIIEINKRIKVVLCKSGSVSGEFRLPTYRNILGEERTTTIHHENGCSFYIDLTYVHFSPRLVRERALIANDVRNHEIIINMFGGLGSFSIEMAKLKSHVKIFNVDINPESIKLCLKNIILNRQRGKVIAVLADAKEFTQNIFQKKVNRILLPLPIISKQYLNLAISKVSKGGIIHYYDFVYASKNESPIEKAFSEIIGIIKNKKITRTNGWIVKSVAPRCYLVSIKLFKL
ncbi:class I SAM-dependent methyltransferase [[Eubacterium] cellulosolvens]